MYGRIRKMYNSRKPTEGDSIKPVSELNRCLTEGSGGPLSFKFTQALAILCILKKKISSSLMNRNLI